MAAVNFITWGYDWYVQRWPWANVGTAAWGHNLRTGFVWDNDLFLDNNLAHPYHGSFYHSSARASGFGFFGSLPFVAMGSATGELFDENIPASLNAGSGPGVTAFSACLTMITVDGWAMTAEAPDRSRSAARIRACASTSGSLST